MAFLAFIAMPCFAFYFSYKHIASGLEIARVSELIETIEDENSAVITDNLTMTTYLYLRSEPHPKNVLKFPGYSLIIMPYSSILEELKNNGKKRAYFIFSGFPDYSFVYKLIAENNFPLEKTSIYEAHGVRAILVEFE